LASSKIETYQD